MASSRTSSERARRAASAVALILAGLTPGCLHGNNAPSREVEVRVTAAGDGFDVAWPEGRLVEIRVGRCVTDCSEQAPSDPTSEFSELVPAPELETPLLWHAEDPAGVLSPLRLGATPTSGTWVESVTYTAPTSADGAVGVFVIVERDRGDGVLTMFGAALLP